MRKISSRIENEISMTNFAKMQKKNMIFRTIFRTSKSMTQILTCEMGAFQRKRENGVRWGGLQRHKIARDGFVQPL